MTRFKQAPGICAWKHASVPPGRFVKSILKTMAPCSLTPWCKRCGVVFQPWSHVPAVTAPCSLSLCVLSAPKPRAISDPSIPRPPDTAGCHVWRACARRLTAQGYLKGCANFALFTAPINSVCPGGSLCVALDVWCRPIDSRGPPRLCCLAFVSLNRLYWCVLSPLTLLLLTLPPHPLLPTPQGARCHSSPPWRPGRGKCRRQQSVRSSMPRKVRPPHFLVVGLLRASWYPPFFASVSFSPSLLSYCFTFPPCHTSKHRAVIQSTRQLTWNIPNLHPHVYK